MWDQTFVNVKKIKDLFAMGNVLNPVIGDMGSPCQVNVKLCKMSRDKTQETALYQSKKNSNLQLKMIYNTVCLSIDSLQLRTTFKWVLLGLLARWHVIERISSIYGIIIIE